MDAAVEKGHLKQKEAPAAVVYTLTEKGTLTRTSFLLPPFLRFFFVNSPNKKETMVHSASECAIPVGRVNRYNVALHGAHVGNRSIILLKGPEFAHLLDGVRVEYLHSFRIPFSYVY